VKYVITGAAGFVGFHLAKQLLSMGNEVVGLDNLNDYYSVKLKQDRVTELMAFKGFSFYKLDIVDRLSIDFITQLSPDVLIHLAAQAGVRYSITNPQAYADSNLQGFLNILEACRKSKPKHFLYASSSSVYGSNSKVPFAEDDIADKPDSFYAATKRSNELMAYSYAHLYGIPSTGLRFFTVYGPWGRPDMAVYKFALAMKNGQTLPVFGDGTMRRDFTYVSDTIKAVIALSNCAPIGDNPHQIVNVGNQHPESVLDLIKALEHKLGLQAKLDFLPIPPGDVPVTFADTTRLQDLTKIVMNTPLDLGLNSFVEWFNVYHK